MRQTSRLGEARRHVLKSVIGCVAFMFFCCFPGVNCFAQSDPVRFDIPSQKLQNALDAFVETTGFSLMYNNLDFGNATSNAISGQYTPEQALNLMLEGTGLTYDFTSRDTVAIKKNTPPPQTEEVKKKVENTTAPAGRLNTTRENKETTLPVKQSNATLDNKLKETQEDVFMLDEMIVTGVFDERKKIESTMSITTIEADEIARRAPASAADLLKDIPGVYVNSSLGEIRNVVYSRGVSAGSTEAAEGYTYVSIQEDSLPVANAVWGNFGPDYFLRPDANLARLEAVRGGTAAVTTTNAPGGIYNYLSKTGGDEFEGLVSARYGLEGNGKNPYQRADFNIGGPLDNGFYYNFGGFYRDSVGARDPGYDLNKGGQVKGNLVKKYDSGCIKLYMKYLDDHNGWFEFDWARNFHHPHLVSGLGGRNGSTLTPSGGTTTWDGRRYDPTDLVHSKDKAVGLDWSHDIDDSLSIRNNLKYSNKSSHWNTTGAIVAHQLDDPYTWLGLNGPQTMLTGTYDFYDRSTGETVASIYFSAPFGPGTVQYNGGLKNSQLQENTVFTQNMFINDNRAKEWMDQLTVTKRLENMTLTGGMYYATSDIYQLGIFAGGGYSSFENQPRLYGITLTTDSGDVYQVTDPNGYWGQPFGRNINCLTQDNLAFYIGHDWMLSDQWNLDSGIRWEQTRVEGRRMFYDMVLDGVGADSDPTTLYNFGDVYNPDRDAVFKKNLDTLAYSVAVNFNINDTNSIYVRYSNSEKAPFLNFYNFNSQEQAEVLNPVAERLQQLEAGYKWYTKEFYLIATPFYSLLSDLRNASTGALEDGVTTYALDPLHDEIETIGIELEGEYRFTDEFSVRGTGVIQKAKAKRWLQWLTNENGMADDEIVDFSGGDADNNPDMMFTFTPTYNNGVFFGSLSWRYMGDRPANVRNTFMLRAFSYVDVTGAYTSPNNRWSVRLNVNNVFNSDGIMSWQGPGNVPAALDRQAFTPEALAANPDALFGVITIPQRAYFLNLSYIF